MADHRAPGGGGVGFQVSVGIQLGKEIAKLKHTQGMDPGLVTVITGAPIPFPEGARHGELRQFLAVAEDAELCLARKYLAPSDDGCLSRTVSQAVVGDDLADREGQVCFRLSLRHNPYLFR
jgi:hypothetical protein